MKSFCRRAFREPQSQQKGLRFFFHFVEGLLFRGNPVERPDLREIAVMALGESRAFPVDVGIGARPQTQVVAVGPVEPIVFRLKTRLRVIQKLVMSISFRLKELSGLGEGLELLLLIRKDEPSLLMKISEYGLFFDR